jgi:hypothetical protein
MQKWFEAMLAGAADAKRELRLVFTPLHFSRDEVYSTVDRLPKKTYLSFGTNYVRDTVNLPFMSRETKDYLARMRQRRKGAVLALDPTLGYPLGPIIEPPLPYHTLDLLREAAKSGADALALGSFGSVADGRETPTAMAIKAGVSRPPKSWVEIERTVSKIAAAHVGRRLAPALVSAWRDIHAAFTAWPAIADTNHMLYVFYSIMGDRWLVRPLVPAPERIRPEDKAYYAKYLHAAVGTKEENSFLFAEGVKNYQVDEMKWLVAMLDEMMMWADRAIATLDGAAKRLDKEDAAAQAGFLHEQRRVAILRAFWRTQRNVMRTESTIEFFTGERKDEYWHVVRRDESFLLPATYRRLFLEAMDDEIANCKEIIALLTDKGAPVINTGETDEQYVFGKDLPELLGKKIALMEAHKGDIDLLFPNCPEETFTDPTYEWADKRHR